MHVLFIPYGTRQVIENFFRDCESQNFQFPITNPKTGEVKTIWLRGAIRQLPFGIYEYVFPKEYRDVILTTFRFNIPAPYHLGKARLSVLRKLAKCKKAPKEFDTSQKMVWLMENLSIIPLGIREDDVFIEPSGESEGWTHEAI